MVGGVFLPKDGQANPIDITQALAKGARQRGARIVENIKVDAHPGRARAGRSASMTAGGHRRGLDAS